MTSKYSLLEALGIDRSPAGSATSELLESHGIDTPGPEVQEEEVDAPDKEGDASGIQSAKGPTLAAEGLASLNKTNLMRDDLALARWREMAGLSKKAVRK